MEHVTGQRGSVLTGKQAALAIAAVDAGRLMEELSAMPCPLCPHLIARHSLAGECADCDCHGCVSVAFVEPDAEPEWQPRTRDDYVPVEICSCGVAWDAPNPRCSFAHRDA